MTKNIDMEIQRMLQAADNPKKFYAELPRHCDGCTVCCHAPGIEEPEIRKKAGDKCQHCTMAGGCAIYANRPKVCQSYACLYLTGLIDEKPDTNGVAWTFQHHACPGGLVLLMGHCFDVIATTKEPVAVATMRRFIDESQFVTGIALRDGKNCVSYIWPEGPNEVLAQIIDIDPSDPLGIAVLQGTERDYDIKP